MGKVKVINMKIRTYYFFDDMIEIIPSAIGHFKEKNGEKYLITNSTDKYEEAIYIIKIKKSH